MSEHFYSWVYSLRKQKHKFEKINIPQCALQHYLQQLKYGSNPSIHQQMNG